MDFTFEEEQRLAAQSLRELLDDHCRGSDLRRAAEAADLPSFREACAVRAAKLAELGLSGALVPVEQGGLGLAAVDFVLLAEEAGRAALPESLVEAEGVAHPLLAAMAANCPPATAVLQAAVEGAALVVSVLRGERHVVAGPFADYFLIATAPDELSLLRASDVFVTALSSIDPLRRLGSIDPASAVPLACWRGPAAARAIAAARLRGSVFTAAQLLGLSSRMTEIAVAYALERKQFGRAIGSNQAVKHQLADVQVCTEFARPVVYAASAALADHASGDLADDAARFAAIEVRVAHALVAAGDAADRAARTAIQVHGAMGYSWELDLQFYAKRAWTLVAANGGRSRAFSRVHGALLEAQLALGTDRLFEANQSVGDR